MINHDPASKPHPKEKTPQIKETWGFGPQKFIKIWLGASKSLAGRLQELADLRGAVHDQAGGAALPHDLLGSERKAFGRKPGLLWNRKEPQMNK